MNKNWSDACIWLNLEYIYDIILSAGIPILFSILYWCLCVVINGFECVLSKLSLVIFKGIIYLARHVQSIEATFNHAEIKTPLRLGNVYFEILSENQNIRKQLLIWTGSMKFSIVTLLRIHTKRQSLYNCVNNLVIWFMWWIYFR